MTTASNLNIVEDASGANILSVSEASRSEEIGPHSDEDIITTSHVMCTHELHWSSDLGATSQAFTYYAPAGIEFDDFNTCVGVPDANNYSIDKATECAEKGLQVRVLRGVGSVLENLTGAPDSIIGAGSCCDKKNTVEEFHEHCEIEMTTPSPTDTSTAPTPSPTDTSSGFGDPHMVNILGEHFNIWRLGEVELLRIPRNSTNSTAALRLVANVSETAKGSSECTRAPYMTSMRLGGAWFDNRELSVKMVDGEMRVILGSMSITPSSEQVTVKSKLIVARPSEARVTVQVGNATIDVKHDDFFKPHFYLNMEARNLASLGFEIGGVLGIDDHSVFVQRPTRCEKHILAAVADRHGTHMIASLD
jgi:hypothetical protein